MHEEMRTLLNAYLDGELHGRRLMEMENHLVSCKTCQDELRELRLVSDCLQADPAPEFIPTERFVAQVALSLPRRRLHPLPPKPGRLAWWLIPAGLLGAWFFVQTAFTLTNIITAADMTGLLGHSFSWLGNLGSGQGTIWFSATASLFGGHLAAQSMLSLLNNVSVYGVELVTGFVWQALIVLLYWAWLFIWWLRSNPLQMNVQNTL
jgi:anti-sigma factor RsiW